jgi:PEP-CTERM motif
MKTQVRIASLSLLTILCLMLAVAPAMAQRDEYDNGAYNGTVDAWTINFGYTVSDSYQLVLNHGTLTDFHFVYWDISNTDVLTSVDWCTSGAPSCTPNNTWGAGGLGNLANTALGKNSQGYYLFEADITGITYHPVNPGFITLGNACTTSGCSTNPIFWDENSGVGCGGTSGSGHLNCPSTAYENFLGTIPSEAFTITGPVGGTTPEPGSILLFGSGIVGLAGVLRRRLMG